MFAFFGNLRHLQYKFFLGDTTKAPYVAIQLLAVVWSCCCFDAVIVSGSSLFEQHGQLVVLTEQKCLSFCHTAKAKSLKC